jgi:hypothetical protein
MKTSMSVTCRYCRNKSALLKLFCSALYPTGEVWVGVGVCVTCDTSHAKKFGSNKARRDMKAKSIQPLDRDNGVSGEQLIGI